MLVACAALMLALVQKRTPEAVEMYVGLLDRGVRILVDPLHLEDPG